MRWPWVSRTAFDLLVEERNRLRADVDRMVEHLTRMDRVEHGRPEVPLPTPHRPQLEPMPQRIRDYIEGFAYPGLRKQMSRECFRRHARGVAWRIIEDELIPTEGEPNATATPA